MLINDIDKFRPLNRNILLLLEDKRNTTASGIALTVTANNAFVPDRGVVKAIGNKVSTVEVGEKLLFTRYEGTKLEDIEGNKYLLISEVHIIGKLTDDSDVGIYQGSIGHTPFNTK